MGAHEGVKYPCDQCEKLFSSKGVLKKHQVSVHECIKYPCDQCDNKFTQQEHLKKHKIST